MPTINITQSMVAGVKNYLMDTWKQSMPVFRKLQGKLIRFLPNTNLRNMTMVWKEAVPSPSPWHYGEGRTRKVLQDRYINMGKHNYELTLDWSKFDEEDDQLGDLRSHVGLGVNRFLQLPDKMYSEYFTGTAYYNPQILNAYDGVSLFSATDGSGAARFSVSGGNLIASGSGTTPEGMIHDYAIAQRRFMQFRDPAGELIFSPDECMYENMFAIVPPDQNETCRKLAMSESLRISSGNIVSESNNLVNVFEYLTNPYLTDSSDWYVGIVHPKWKAFVFRSPDSVTSFMADINNSDRARETYISSLYAHIRTAMAIYCPFTLIKINN